jgi:hypothetical protein
MDLLEQDDPDWYLVKLHNGDIGLAPSNYVSSAEDYQQPEQEEQEVAAPIPTPPPPAAPPVVPQASIPPPSVQPILAHTVNIKRRVYLNNEIKHSLFRLVLRQEKSLLMKHNLGTCTNMTLLKRRRRRARAIYSLVMV